MFISNFGDSRGTFIINIKADMYNILILFQYTESCWWMKKDENGESPINRVFVNSSHIGLPCIKYLSCNPHVIQNHIYFADYRAKKRKPMTTTAPEQCHFLNWYHLYICSIFVVGRSNAKYLAHAEARTSNFSFYSQTLVRRHVPWISTFWLLCLVISQTSCTPWWTRIVRTMSEMYILCWYVDTMSSHLRNGYNIIFIE